MENIDRIELFKKLFNVYKNNTIIKTEVPDNFVDGIPYVLEKKLASIEPVMKDDFIMSYWIEYKDGHLLSFPTPPFDKKKLLDDPRLEKFIKDTRFVLSDLMKQNIKKLYLDLRSNLGGFIHLFYDSLYPILPVHDGVVITGVDIDGKQVMSLSEKNNNLNLEINDPEMGKIFLTNKITDPIKYKIPSIEVLVNTRSASSSEIIMIIFSQAGYKITGGPTMGLTSGMLTQKYKEFTVSVPYYWFKDKYGKVYSTSERNKTTDNPKKLTKLLSKNVLAKIPKEILKRINENTTASTLNHIHSSFLENNSHFSINYDKENPDLIEIVTPKCLYIYVPHECRGRVKDIFDRHCDKVLSGFPIVIDLRNSKLKGIESVEIFDGIFSPYEVPLKESNNKIDKLGSFYISNQYPYFTLEKHMVVGVYANADIKFWTNKNTIHGDGYGVVLLRYLINHFGLLRDSKLSPFINHSLYKFVVDKVQIELFTCSY